MNDKTNTPKSIGIGRLLAAALIVATLVPATAGAQDRVVTGEPATSYFTPTLFLMGTTTNNELRDVATPVQASSLYSEAELPFSFRGPRLSGGFSINPAWRQYRDPELQELNQFEAGLSGWLTGSLGPRTRLNIVVGGAYTTQLTALDSGDIITPRTQRTRSRGSASLSHRLNARGDAFDLNFDYDGTDYLEDDFVGSNAFGLLAGYSRALDARLSVSLSGRVDRIQYDDGTWVNAGTPLLGLSYAVAPRTDLSVRGGISFSQRGGSETLLGDEARQNVAVSADLRHRGENWSLTLSSGQRVATGVAIGEPTLRRQLIGILDWQDARWRIGINAGIASNRLLQADGDAVIVTPDGPVVTDAEEIRTFTSCLGVGFRALSWMSVVGSGQFGLQRPVGASDALDLDVYRFSFGFALHPQAPPINTAAGSYVLGRYGRAGSFGSC